MYRHMSKSTRPLPLRVRTEVFTAEWRRCSESPTRDTGFLALMLQPMFEHWANLLMNGGEKDLNYIAFARSLASEGVDPIEGVARWVEHHQYAETIVAELEFIVYRLLRKLKVYRSTRPLKLEMVIAYYFRRGLQRTIRDFNKKALDVPVQARTFEPSVSEDVHPDWLFIKTAGLSDWEQYILLLNQLGYTSQRELSAVTHVPKTTILREERTIWQPLRWKLSQAE